MLFNSVQFLMFFPVVCILYFLIPWHRARNLFLLAASYFFYMSWNYKYGLLLLGSTLIAWIFGLLIEKAGQKKPAKGLLLLAALLEFGLLFLFKYFGFFVDLWNAGVSRMEGLRIEPSFSFVLPVGISFYIFQNFSYIFDVYRMDAAVERDFFEYALYVSFFPQLVAGPIEQAKRFLAQFKVKHEFDYDRMKRGLLAMLWGYFLKLVIADRAALYVDAAFAGADQVRGCQYFFAVTLFLIQVYCDFAGYSMIAVGAGEVMGFTMTDNFQAPYLSKSVSELWRRWHVSLYTWFRDYLYIPLGGGRKGKVRKYINVMIVCALSGLWHGANLTFVIWALLNGFYQMIGALKNRIKSVLCEKTDTVFWKIRNWFPVRAIYRVAQSLCVCVLFLTTLVFFRAVSLTQAIEVYRRIFTDFTPNPVEEIFALSCGISVKEWVVFALALIILTIADIAKYRGVILRDRLMKKPLSLQWMVYIAGMLAVLLFGIYGKDNSSFIYFVF